MLLNKFCPRKPQRPVHTDTQTHRDTETQRHRDTETQRHRQTDRHADTQTHRHTDTETHTHRHTETQRHHTHTTQTQRQTHRHTHRHRHRHTHRHTDTQRHRDTDTHTHTTHTTREISVRSDTHCAGMNFSSLCYGSASLVSLDLLLHKEIDLLMYSQYIYYLMQVENKQNNTFVQYVTIYWKVHKYWKNIY